MNFEKMNFTDSKKEEVFDFEKEISNISMNFEKMNFTASKKEEVFDIENDHYIETPFHIIESYFKGQHLERLVRHQLESYNNFVEYQITKTIEMFNPVHIASENDFDPNSKKYSLELFITFENFNIYRPQIYENNGAIKLMFPQEARLRNFTYASAMTVDMNIKYIVRTGANLENAQTFYKTLHKIHIGKLPIMLKSNICVLNQYKHVDHTQTGECRFDAGGYFIINGSEKTVLGQERAAENKVYCFNISKNNTKYHWLAEVKSVPDFKCISPKQVNMMISSKNNGFGNVIHIQIPRLKQPLPLFIVFRALGVISDKEICEKILLDVKSEENKILLNALQASIMDADKYLTQEESIKYITSYAMFTPINMDKETGARKKMEFTMDILNNDLFPHTHNNKEKIYFLGYMANKLLKTSFKLLKTDDRDSYINKRIDLTGTLLNNLFRNYFNKLVKDMEKQIVREINNGSWKSKDDYDNIVNQTNIYKIIKSTTIENGIKRALATGDFGIKNTNSNKVGVAQVLNRLTYVSSLSHARRISTPTDKSGKLIPPRKLHNTSWGFVCPAETPEGQSVGIVKNLSYMTHITIYSNSHPLYEYILPEIKTLTSENITNSEIANEVKVFINGAWVGMTDRPRELYSMLKDKKYRGMINIYTSIIFDYHLKEIRLCNDAGRLCRPVLRIKDNNLLILPSIIKKIQSSELNWDDLFTNTRIEDSILEYIDPDEQNNSMIATVPKDIIQRTNDTIYNYTHCEIHPSTIFGILASCIPFPENNQSPRNCYQCLDINETVMLSNGSKIPIKDIKLHDEVVCFNPETMEISYTKVINHFIIQNITDVFEIILYNNKSIIATLDHKFMTNQGWKTVEQLIYILNENTEELKTHANIGVFEDNLKNYDFINIKTIEKVNDRLVCDITVESDNHSFITSHGIMSSNCAQGKQAMGVYVTNYENRMDKTAYVLNYPTRPLVDTRIMNMIQLNKIPSGTNVIVAIMTHTGYNQEDSLLFNKGSIDRGLFVTTVYHTEKDEDKQKINGDEEIRCKPDPTKTKGMKMANYQKVNSKGVIPENTLVENRDVIISKIVPIKENRNDHTKVIKYEDQSKIYRTAEETYIDKNYIDKNGDGYNFAKIRLRTFRKPVIGDKFCALPTQQVLTNVGWIEIKDVDINLHKLATLDGNGKLCYESPVAKYEYDHDDKMYFIQNKQVHIVCTLNHRLYVKKRAGKSYELIEAKDVMGKMVRFQKTMENVYPDMEFMHIGDKSYKMDNWLQLLGMFIADGWCDKTNKRIFITAIKERKIQFVRNILDNLGIDYSYHRDGNYFISGVKYPEIYEQILQLSVGALNKTLPNYVWNLSKRQSILLLEALLQGDGNTTLYKGEEEFSRYGTISIQLANDITRLALHCGWSGIIKVSEEPTRIARIGKRNLGSRAGQEVSITQKHTYYKVSIIRKQNEPWINKKKNESNEEKLINYQGKVYCVEMPSSHTYYMRESNFSPCLIIGNSSRHGQKGTIGNIIPESDMPFTSSGLKPDIIINPHAIPSRMTIGQLKETLLGKVLVQLGLFGDGTSFGKLEVNDIRDQLINLGYESNGNELLYNGLTGEQVECSVFMGPVFYQRLKHMVVDKAHSRSIGPMVNLTRQPAEGRSRDGGLRFGEMERDCCISHGASRFTRERLYDVSDKYSVHVCKKCGLIASYNEAMNIHHCRICDNRVDFAYVEIPYACKLLFQELNTMNIAPRIMTEH
jgi:DNA-directed RNA polymerase beta subunit